MNCSYVFVTLVFVNTQGRSEQSISALFTLPKKYTKHVRHKFQTKHESAIYKSHVLISLLLYVFSLVTPDAPLTSSCSLSVNL